MSAVEPTAGTDRLAAEGVFNRDVLQELRGQPVDHINQVIRYVARCRTRDDPRGPGLIVYLLRQGVAAQTCGRLRPVTDWARAPGKGDRQGRSNQPVRAGSPTDGPTIDRAADGQPTPCMTAARAPALDQLWHQVLAQLATRVEAPAYDTWLAPSRLLLLDDGEAVVGVPNVFVRDVLVRTYAGQLEAALEELYSRPIALQVITAPASTGSNAAAGATRRRYTIHLDQAHGVVAVGRKRRILGRRFVSRNLST